MDKFFNKQSEGAFTYQELQELSIKRPILAQLELTHNCNQSCLFCFRACDQKEVFSDLTLRQWLLILEKLSKFGVLRLGISGGEPLLFSFLEVFLKESKTRGFFITLTTNGSQSLLKSIKHLDEVIFSIHDLGKEHDKITGRKGSFALAEKHLSEVLNTSTKVGINTVLIKSNFWRIEKIYNYFAQKYKNLDHHSFDLAIGSLSGRNFKKNIIKLNRKKFSYLVESINKIPPQKRLYKHGLRALLEEEENKQPNISLPDCAGGKYKIVVNYQGDVYPCNYFIEKKYHCGNLLKEDLGEIWRNGKGFKPFREMFLNNDLPTLCQACRKKGRCLAGCRVFTKSYLMKGEFSSEKDFRCAFRNAYAGDRDHQ